MNFLEKFKKILKKILENKEITLKIILKLFTFNVIKSSASLLRNKISDLG